MTCKHRFTPVIRLLICVLLLIGFTSTAYASGEAKRVLVLNSYHQGYTWTDDEVKGLSDVLLSSQLPIKLYVEYMGTKWSSTPDYMQQLKDIYIKKFKVVNFDLIVATDNDALDFLIKYRTVTFGNTPVVFCGVNWFRAEQISGQLNYTGVNEDADMEATLDVMMKLHPKTNEVLMILDSTTTGNIVFAKAKEIEPKYSGKLKFTYLRNMTIEQIAKTLAKAPDNSLALITIFQRDSSGSFYEFSESTPILSKASRVPVYGLWDFNLGYGILGGMLTSGYEQGHMAGMISSRVLGGEKADSIPVVMKSPNKYIFDYQQMERFNIPRSALPARSTLINQPSSLYSLNKGIVWTAIAASFFAVLIIIILMANIRKRKHAEDQLRKAHDELEQRVEERTADLGKANHMLITEIEERIDAEKQLDSKNSELEKANIDLKNAQAQMLQNEKMASIGTLAAGVAHEINNPMGFISSNLGALQKHNEKILAYVDAQENALEKCRQNGVLADILDELSAQKKSLKVDYLRTDIFNIIQESKEGADRVKKIVQNLKSFSRIDESETSLADLNDCIDRVINILSNEIKYKAKVKIGFGHIPLTMCNPGQLGQVFMNIIVNAAQSIEKDGIISIDTREENGMIVVDISDNGAGIPPDVMKRIFEPFFTTKDVGAGTGLGLSISYDIIKKHGGNINVESEQGVGTKFTLRIPVVSE